MQIYSIALSFILETQCILFLEKSTTEKLCIRLKADDKEALAELYNDNVRALYNYGNKIAHSAIVVEDAIQDLFIDVWNYRKNLGEIRSMRAYLYASLRRKIVKSLNQNSVLNNDYRWDDLNLLDDSHEEKIIAKENSDERTIKLRANLKNLSPRQYEAIVLRFYDKLQYQEIATIMEMNEQSARNLIQRGIESLRQYSGIIVSLILIINFLFN